MIRPTTSEEGFLVSRGLMTQILEDLASCKAKLGIEAISKPSPTIMAHTLEPRPYRIDSSVASGGRRRYSGTRMMPVASESSAKGYIEMPGPIVMNNLYSDGDAIGNEAPAVAAGTIVWAREFMVMDGTTPVLEMRFSPGGGGGALPTGEYDGMVYQMVSDSQSGWDFVRAGTVPDPE